MDYLSINKNLWNEKTDIHFDSEFYNVKAFVDGQDSLNHIELELLGDIQDKKILHLQCHFGMDSISLAKRGAKATAIDLSDKAISRAKQLNEKMGTDVKFLQSDVYQLSDILEDEFDIVFTSYGVLGWLPDMDKWAKVVSHFLKPKGKLILVEFHPIVWMFDYDFKKVEYNYQHSQAIVEELEGTYANKESEIKEKSVSWNHGLAEVISALLSQGLCLEALNEHNYSPYNCFNHTVETEPGKFKIQGLEDKFPLCYSLCASKN